MLPCELNFELLTTCLKKVIFSTHLYQKKIIKKFDTFAHF